MLRLFRRTGSDAQAELVDVAKQAENIYEPRKRKRDCREDLVEDLAAK